MSTMVSVTTAEASDLAAIAQMRVALGWHPNSWLLAALHASPIGQLFLIRAAPGDAAPADAAPERPASAAPGLLAAASAVAYGRRGFIGNVMVQPGVQRRGLGRLVMSEALRWLRARGVAVVELDATPEGRPLYARLGFVGTRPSWVMHGQVGPAQRGRLETRCSGAHVETLGPDTLGKITPLDRTALGGDRRELLRAILRGGGSRLYAARDGDEYVGYVMVRPLEGDEPALRIGPWVARSPGVAADLLLAAVPSSQAPEMVRTGSSPTVRACIADANRRALDLCRACSLDLTEDDLRMRLTFPDGATGAEPAPLGRPDWVYAMTAPMVG